MSAVAEPAPPADEEPPLEDGRLLDHAYDGIREYDNPLPGWWKAIFIGSIVFAGVYVLWLDVLHWGHSPQEAYETQLADYLTEYRTKAASRERAEAASVDEATLTRNAQDSRTVSHGAQVFAVKCVSCHTEDGHGLIGPNLTDLYQLHGTTRMDIYHTVHDGVTGTAMLAWGEQLPVTDVIDVVTFVTTLRGKNIPGKEPQGVPVPPFSQ